ncbi:uncharacterized protein ACA1_227720 [Acanthamoeba castellanii str. Neff]|uniref:Uncharacterized protein n=1 Tax=Acanthamoeba castellanii (strain ATCC 30010 / Neff) TaxID=1257118 RepID=L8HB04_ACACF|nr:uncharacterized protein ACA1_227720 [Acanthamoeba castellanii str. Neff]ELR21571.1 hypothetical protein ACA1_227720 [Acanthamoeba castellanii str. Neff]
MNKCVCKKGNADRQRWLKKRLDRKASGVDQCDRRSNASHMTTAAVRFLHKDLRLA